MAISASASTSTRPHPAHPAGERVQPGPQSPRGSFIATVQENRRLCTDHFRLILRVSGFPKSTPGQFVQLDCRDQNANAVASPSECESAPREWEWSAAVSDRPRPDDPDFAAPVAYLRRPFSIADHRPLADGSSEIDIIHRVVGRGTSLLATLHTGQSLSLLGPLGVGFTVPENLQTACLVGGGVGIPPMLYLAKALAQQKKSAIGFIGAMRHDLLPIALFPTGIRPDSAGEPLLCVEEFAGCGHLSVVTTDDGSIGMKGFVTAALRRFLENRREQNGSSPDSLQGVIVYCCGPTPMMKATAKVAAEFSVPCQVSLEQPMACGMGTCQSCIIRYRPHNAASKVASTAVSTEAPTTDWKYKLTCTDGPVFDTRDIVW